MNMSESTRLAHAQSDFRTAMPRLVRHGRCYFRHVRCRHRKADFIAEMIGLCPTESGNLSGYTQDLLLKDEHSTSVAKDRFQSRMQISDRFLSPVTSDKGLRHTASAWSWFEKSICNRHIPDGVRL